MAQPTALPRPRPTPVPISLDALLPWAAFGLLLAFVVIYLVGAEQGAFSFVSGETVHEFMHVGRHLLGFPCHRPPERR